MRRFLRENALSLALLGLFVIFLAGQSVTGLRVRNDDAVSHGGRPLGYLGYLSSGHFIEAVFENWESEFLQMAAFVLLTIGLRQKGSSESKPLEESPEPAKSQKPRKSAPWAARRGGWVRRIYENSLSIALTLLFVLSFVLHAVGGADEENRARAQRARHGEPPVGRLEYVGTPRFWFESFQNWQSEFLAVGALIVLSIFLRQKGSPQSKEVEAPHAETVLDLRSGARASPVKRNAPRFGARHARTRRSDSGRARSKVTGRASARPSARSRPVSGRRSSSSSRSSWSWSLSSDTRGRVRRSPRSENQPG